MVDISNLTEEGLGGRVKLQQKLKGHGESRHAEVWLIFISFLIVAQILLVLWKKFHIISYQIATLVGMWIIPPIQCFILQWYRFIVIWSIFSIITAYVAFRATRQPVAGTTPRFVYKWFLLVYKATNAIVIAGCGVITFALCDFYELFVTEVVAAVDLGVLLLFYGLYLGVVSGDLAEVCAEKMASWIGYYTATGLPTRKLEPNVCAICGNKIILDNNEALIEGTYKLNCDHIFHEFCIRGWYIVGKKQTCPYCKENVDLIRMFSSPWEKPHIVYGYLLGWIRYLVAWHPVIVIIVKGICRAVGL